MIAALIIFGLIGLYIGADLLVKHASHLASMLGISSIIIGLTIVAFGTSTPELIVNIVASLSGKSDIAVGNIVGSNIFNILFILGISAIVCPLVVHQQLIRLDVPIMIGASMAFWWIATYKNMAFYSGVVFFFCMIAYTSFLIFKSSKDKKNSEFEKEFNYKDKFTRVKLFKDVFFIILGLGVLVISSNWLVDGSVQLARIFGISELMISLTIVAAGTSLPELAASVVAAFRGERDIAVGNIVGSNIYNIFAILGISAILSPGGLEISDQALSFDIPVMTLASIACLPIFFSGHTIYRFEGFIFIGYYVAYIAILVMQAISHPWLATFKSAMLFFILPLTLLTICVELFNFLKGNKK